MSTENLYNLNHEISNMFGGQMLGNNYTICLTLTFLIVSIVIIILFLSGVLTFSKPQFIMTPTTEKN
jgi:hypothetical protein